MMEMRWPQKQALGKNLKWPKESSKAEILINLILIIYNKQNGYFIYRISLDGDMLKP